MASARLQINVISAQNLYNADGILAGKSDPYVIVEVPGQPEMKFQTPVINNNLNPEWNHIGEIHGFMDGDELQFTVMDSDTWPKKDQPLGKATLTVQDFYPDGLHAELQLAESKTSATLTVQIAVVGSDEVMMEGGQVMMQDGQVMMEGGQAVPYEYGQQAVAYEGGQQVVMEGGQQVMMQGGQEMGGAGMYVGQDGMQVEQVLAVSVMNARGLYNADGFLAGKSDPYCICSIPGKPHAKFTTPTINNCLDPDWNHTEELVGFQLGDSLEFEVWDSDTKPKPDQLLGKVMLSPEDLAAHPDGLTGVLQLSGGMSQEMGTLEVCIQFLGLAENGGLNGQIAIQEGGEIQMQQQMPMQQVQQMEAQSQMMAEAAQAPVVSVQQEETYVQQGVGGQAYRVKVIVVKANGLYNADGFMAGKSDPYVICQVPGHKEKKFQTKVINNCLDPVWDHLGIIENVLEGEPLELGVWDKDTFPKPDDFLGKVVIPSADFLYQVFDNEVMLQESKAPNATITIRIEAEPEFAGASQTANLAAASATPAQVYQAEAPSYTTGTTTVTGSAPAVGGCAGGVQYVSGTSVAGGAPSYSTTLTSGQPAPFSAACAPRAGQPTVYSSVGQSPTVYGASPVATKVEYQGAAGQQPPPPGYQMYTGPIYNSQTARPSMPSVTSYTSAQQASATVEPTVCAAPSQSSTTFTTASAPAPTYSQAPATTTYTQAAAPVTYSQPTPGVTNFSMQAAMPAALPSAIPANAASSTAQPLTIFSSPTAAPAPQVTQVTQAPAPVSTMYAAPAATMASNLVTTSPALQAAPVGSFTAQQGAPVTYVSQPPATMFAPATTYATPQQMTASQQIAGVPQASTYAPAPAPATTYTAGFPAQATTRGPTYTMSTPGQPFSVPAPGGGYPPVVGSAMPTMAFQQPPMQVQSAQPVAYAAPTMMSSPGMQPTILPSGAVTAGMQQPGLMQCQGVQPSIYQPGVPVAGMQMSTVPGTFETTVH